MKQLIVSLFLLALGYAQAQTEKIDEICQSYDEKIQQAIEEEAPLLVPQMKITCQLTKRAIGPVDHMITIYFDEYETEVGQPGQEVFNKEAVIRKVEFTVSAVSYTTTFKYYFDEGGLLIKHIQQELGYQCFIKEQYFREKNLIRITQNPIESEDCFSEEKIEAYDHKTPTKTEKASASWLLEDADKFRQILFSNYELFKN